MKSFAEQESSETAAYNAAYNGDAQQWRTTASFFVDPLALNVVTFFRFQFWLLFTLLN